MAPASWFELYSRAARASFRVWPLFLVKFLFLVLQSFALVFCLVLLLGPFVTRNFENIMAFLRDPQTQDPSAIAADWFHMVTDPTWIGIFLGLGLLYTTWWCFLSALEDGGIYGTFEDLAREGKTFSPMRFFQWAFRVFWPMVWLQVYLGFWLLIPMLLACLVIMGATLILSLVGFGWGWVLGLGLIVGAPLFISAVLFGLAFLAFGFLARAHVVKGLPAGAAMRATFQMFRSQGWRVGLGLMVPLAVYFVGGILLRVLSMVLGAVPFLGLLFGLAALALEMGSYLFFMIFLAGLSVDYQEEAA